MDTAILKLGWTCKCPKCGQGDLYASRVSLSLKDNCDVCGLNLADNDSADGPAVFLIFILGFAIVPIALLIDYLYAWPVWLHGIVWGFVSLAFIIASMRPLKAYIIALQFKHRPNDWQ